MKFNKAIEEALSGQTINNVVDPNVLKAQEQSLQKQLASVKEPDERAQVMKNIQDAKKKADILQKQQMLQKQMQNMQAKQSNTNSVNIA